MIDLDMFKVPSIVDFAEHCLGMSCLEKHALHTKTILELRSKFHTAEVMVAGVSLILRPMLSKTPDNKNFTGDPNIDRMVDRLTNPKTLGDCALSTFFGNTSMINFELNLNLSRIMSAFFSSDQNTLFSALEKIENFIKETEIMILWKDARFLEQNLKYECNMDTLMSDDFMWSNRQRTEFILPVDMSTSNIRISKFFNDLSRVEMKNAYELQIQYEEYKFKKREIIRQGELQARRNNVPDANNVFMGFGVKQDLLNTKIDKRFNF